MTAEEYLTRYRRMSTRIKMLQDEIKRLQAEAESMQINLDGMPRGSNVSDKIARLAVQIAEYRSTLEEEIAAVYRESMKIVELIGKVENPHQQTLLYKRYIEGKKWGEIAGEMRYTYQWVAGPLHIRALRSFESAMKGAEK